MRRLLLATLLAVTSLGPACSSKDASTPTKTLPPEPQPEFWGPDCDPLVPWHCGFPFPSNTQLADDPTTVTKKRVAFKAGALPRPHGLETNPSTWSSFDGFSTGTTITTYLWRATATGLPNEDELPRSASKDSQTVLIDAETGEFVPHIAGVDMQSKDEDERALLIRPVVRLKDATRYLVAIRKVVDKDGDPLPASKAFAALRDKTPDSTIEARRKLYDDDIFPKLEKFGIARGDLQIAWDFTTGSRGPVTDWLIHMRDDALKTVGDLGPEYTIDAVKDDPCDSHNVKRKITGRFKVPIYVDKPDPPSRLVFGPDGMPKQNGFAEFTFTVWIPNSVVGKPGPLLQNGHGLLGGQGEGGCGYLTDIADKWGYVAFSVDWVGMAGDADRNVLTDAIVGDIGNFQKSVDRQHQGMINMLLAMRMMKGRFKDDPNVQFDGKSAIDPTQGCFYRGDSQGGIFGGTYLSISTDVTRGLLSVPGAPYSFLLDRSVDFVAFHFLLQGAYTSALDLPIVLGLVQMMWDRTEPNGYIRYLERDMLPNTPQHHALIQVAIGDHQVSPLGAHYMARTIGAKLMTPFARPIAMIPTQAYPLENGSGMIEFDSHQPEAPKVNLPPEAKGDDPHELVRRLNAAQKQADTFFRTGKIVQTCDGPCDPE